MRLKIKQILPAMCVTVLLAGCGKKAEPAPPVAASGVPEAAAPAANPNGNVDLEQMSRDVRRWILKNQRPPKDFAEYAATPTAPIPPAPAGKKFTISKDMHVVLVNR